VQWNRPLVHHGIYFIPNAQPFSVRFLSFSSRKQLAVAKLPRTPAWGFSVSPDGRWLLYSEWEALHADLMLVENLR